MDIDQLVARDYIGRIVTATGLSATEVAREVGLAPSTLTRIYPQPQVKHTLSARTIAKIDRRFPGHSPPGLQSYAPPGQPVAHTERVGERQTSFAGFAPVRDVPIYATTLAREPYDVHGVGPIELLEFHSNPVGHFKRPSALDALADVRAAYVAGSAMDPRLRAGEAVFVDMRRPARNGDEVAVVLRSGGGSETNGGGELPKKGFIRTLVRQSISEIELEQYSPPLRFTLPMSEVAEVWRLIPWGELIGAN